MRQAVHDDVEALVALEALCLGPDAWSEGLVREGVAGGLPTVVWVVADGGEGYAVASYVGDVVELQRIGVHPDARRRGLARRLLEAVRAHATTEDRVIVEVREDNAGALAFYAAAGFTELARRRRYYRDGTTAVVLQRPLSGR